MRNFVIWIVGGAVIVSVGFLVVAKFNTNARSIENMTQRQLQPVIQETNAASLVFYGLDGTRYALSDYKGKKPVILDFWAAWCPNCHRNMEKMNALYQTYKDRVEIIGVNLQEDRNIVERFIQEKNFSFPIALDSDRRATDFFGVQYTNTHILLDRNGNKIRTVSGDVSEADIQSLLQ